MNMMENDQRKGPISWIGLVVGALVLVALAPVPLRVTKTVETIPIRVDSKGTPWLGPLPLHNEKVRDLVLSAVHRACPKGMIELTAYEGESRSSLVAVAASLASAGVQVRAMHIRFRTPAQTTDAPAVR